MINKEISKKIRLLRFIVQKKIINIKKPASARRCWDGAVVVK